MADFSNHPHRQGTPMQDDNCQHRPQQQPPLSTNWEAAPDYHGLHADFPAPLADSCARSSEPHLPVNSEIPMISAAYRDQAASQSAQPHETRSQSVSFSADRPIQHHDRAQEAPVPMNNYYRPSQAQSKPLPPDTPAQLHCLPCLPGPEGSRRVTSSTHGLDGGFSSASHRPAPPLHSHACSSEPFRHDVDYKCTPQLPPTVSAHHHPTPSSSMQPPQAYDSQIQPACSSTGDQPIRVNVVQVKRKNTRAAQACDSCRQLKVKCDETRPCKTCRDRGTECKYRDPPPKPVDNTQFDILDGIAKIQSQLGTLTENFARMDERLTKIESVAFKGDPPAKLNPVVVDQEMENQYKEESTPYTGDETAKYSSQDAAIARPHQTILPEDEEETQPGPPPPPGEPAIPKTHTTMAGLLLNWPSIQDLTKHHVEREGVGYVGEYPISQEQKRGSLLVYGRGEDNRTSRKQREREHGLQNDHISDNSPDSYSTSTATEAADWGTFSGQNSCDQADYISDVLIPDGTPDFPEKNVWSYVEAFKDNILNLHPIVQPAILDEWVRQFLDRLPLQDNKHSGKVSTAWAVNGSVESTGSKRKRSCPAPHSMDMVAASATSRIGQPHRTMDTALILTVLALGKVCQHRDYVPDALHEGDPMPHRTGQFHRNNISQAPKGSPPVDISRSQTSSKASPRVQDSSDHRRRSSLASTARPDLLKKNDENIPGLEYFAFATDILGNHLGSYNNMKNVYADIFAGLYQGQLGRPLESFAFIHRASHKLQVIMRPSLERLKRLKTTREFIKDTKYNQLSLAFWTCLQLESDILAELPVPPSGLLSYENDIPHPNMSLLEGFPKPVLDSYLGQLYLRTHLNSIHRMFYAAEDPAKGAVGGLPFKNVDFVSASVSGMQWVGPSFAFKEEDPPASDILSARLRAKYWGAQVLTYRPFLGQILQFSYAKSHPTTGQLPSSEFRAEVEAPRIDPQARNVQDLNPHILVLAQKAIKALVESTRAFHGLGDKRPVITSVFSTAHAQWGNLLVLSAAFKDPIMHEYVDENLLRHLFQKTIAFLRQSATATSSLRIDMHILEGLQKDFWDPTSHDNSKEYSPNNM